MCSDVNDGVGKIDDDLSFSALFDDDEFCLTNNIGLFDEEGKEFVPDKNIFDACDDDELNNQQGDQSAVFEPLPDLGQNKASWKEYLKGLGSSNTYQNRIFHFLRFVLSNMKKEIGNFSIADDQYLEQQLILYFECMRSLKKKDDERIPRYGGTTLRGWFSMFFSFWLHTGRGNLSEKVPIIEVKIKQWENNQSVKKSAVFTKEDLIQLHALPNTPEILMLKFYSVIACAFAARGAELVDLKHSNLKRQQCMDTGDVSYKIIFSRSKNRGTVSTVSKKSKKSSSPINVSHLYITGSLEVKCIEKYVECFSMTSCSSSSTTTENNTKEDRLFRKLKYDELNNRICSTNQVIGKNTLSKYPRNIAAILHLKDPENYTGHCFRRSSITFLADAGLSLPQIKNVSGHRSDTVVTGYIDNSEQTKMNGANAIALLKNNNTSNTNILTNNTSNTTANILNNNISNINKRYKIDEKDEKIFSVNINFSGANIHAPIHFMNQTDC
jgi:integrase